jgi:hypothetical protein
VETSSKFVHRSLSLLIAAAFSAPCVVLAQTDSDEKIRKLEENIDSLKRDLEEIKGQALDPQEVEKRRIASDKEAVKTGEERGFLESLKAGFAPSNIEYDPAPYTPMLQKLHRQERFGLHIHNVEVRYSDQPGLTTTSHSQFQAATAELEASGFVFPGLVFVQVVVEPRDNLGRGLGDSIAKNIPPGNNAPTGILRDAFVDLVLNEPGSTVRLGQQRIPFGIEPQTPGGLLPFTSRSYLDLKLTRNPGQDNTQYSNAEFVQERDYGVQTRGRLWDGKFDYAVGAFNGAGINVNDTNNSKDVVGRLGFNPYKGLRFGISGYEGQQVNILSQTANRNRVGGDFELTQDLLPRFRLMGEAAQGYDGPFQRKAWYVQSFYEIIPQATPKSPGLLFGVRYDKMKENASEVGGRDDNIFKRWTVGFNYYFLNAVSRSTGYWQQVKFQLEYEFRKHDSTTTALEAKDTFDHDFIIAQMTFRY